MIAQANTKTSYYAFGSPMPNRQFNNGNYRYGFNGKENDNEVKGTGNQQDYGKRIYDPRIGKFLSVDPLQQNYPELTTYQFASNSPIQAIDLDGLEQYHYTLTKKDGQTTFKLNSVENDWIDKNLQEFAVYISYNGGTYRFTNDVDPVSLHISQIENFVKNPENELAQLDKRTNEFLEGVAIGVALNAGSNSAIRSFGFSRSNVKTINNSQAESNGNVSSSGVKKVYIDKTKYPEAAKHIDDAQASGQPIGGIVDRAGASARRREALKDIKTVSNKDRDEYPPAILSTGGKGSSVRLIDKSDNRGAGASMGNQLRDVPDGTQVELHTSPTYNITPK
ncbi:MAG: RHS repeat-associated core domain-containing protein [Bacteroidota bacterium]|nr:RHS repeat-associated core domain-containing protein [Bacteroidota bacterium]